MSAADDLDDFLDALEELETKRLAMVAAFREFQVAFAVYSSLKPNHDAAVTNYLAKQAAADEQLAILQRAQALGINAPGSTLDYINAAKAAEVAREALTPKQIQTFEANVYLRATETAYNQAVASHVEQAASANSLAESLVGQLTGDLLATLQAAYTLATAPAVAPAIGTTNPTLGQSVIPTVAMEDPEEEPGPA